MELSLQILVDADACPNVIKQIIFKTAVRVKITTTLFANHGMSIPPSPWIHFVQMPGGFDVVDDEIVKRAKSGDLIITADIPLASQVVEKKAHALNPRGELYTVENIQQRLAIRDRMTALRDMGEKTRGPAPLKSQDQQAFANAFDRFITKHHKPG